jgi:hypothetical protein
MRKYDLFNHQKIVSCSRTSLTLVSTHFSYTLPILFSQRRGRDTAQTQWGHQRWKVDSSYGSLWYDQFRLVLCLGSGKSTLVDILAGRRKAGTISGTVTVKGGPATEYSSFGAYVMQHDFAMVTQQPSKTNAPAHPNRN